jgi:hypothetical protein
MDTVDRAIVVKATKVSRDSEHEKLTASPSSGSLIITDCGGESSTRSTGSFEKAPLPRVPAGLKIVSLVSMVS